MIRISNATVKKGDAVILDNVSVELFEHRVGIVGRNGSGKSTFAKILNGLERLSSGSVLIYDQDAHAKTTLGKVGFVFQNPDNQIVFPFVGEDLAFGLKKSGLTKDQVQSRILFQLDRFGLQHLLDRRTHELSGGEKQLIALIGVLIMEPEIIVLDEPTTLLDLHNRTLLVRILLQLEQKLIIVSHDLALMEQMNRIIWIESGQIKQDGNPSEVISAYRTFSEG